MSIRAVLWARDIASRMEIPPAERIVLLILGIHHHDKTGECFPAYATLSRETGYRRQRVIEAIKALEANGLVIVQSRRVKGHQGSNHFVLFGHPTFTKWTVTRVQKTGPCESTDGGTLARVRTGGPDKEYLTYRGKKAPARWALSVIDGGLSPGGLVPDGREEPGQGEGGFKGSLPGKVLPRGRGGGHV